VPSLVLGHRPGSALLMPVGVVLAWFRRGGPSSPESVTQGRLFHFALMHGENPFAQVPVIAWIRVGGINLFSSLSPLGHRAMAWGEADGFIVRRGGSLRDPWHCPVLRPYRALCPYFRPPNAHDNRGA
jgi:hypothetical protein